MFNLRLSVAAGLLACVGLSGAKAQAQAFAPLFPTTQQPVAAADHLPTPAAAPTVIHQDGCAEPCCPPKSWEITAGYRAWFSRGNASDIIPGSRFQFRDLDATVHELNLDAVLFRSFLARIDFGFGTIEDGNFQAIGPAGGQVFTNPIVGDELYHLSGDLGYRVLRGGDGWDNPECGSRWAVDVLAGYQHWEEKYTPIGTAGTLFADQYKWESIRIGGRASFQSGRFNAAARVQYIPWTHFTSVGTNTVTLVENFAIKADGGQGVTADFTVSYRIWRGLSVEAGYQIFHVTAGDGSFRIGGVDASTFDRAISTRHGALVGLNYRF